MPTVITKRILSGSTHGAYIGVTATQGATANPIHQLSTSSTATVDEIYLYGNNVSSATVELCFEIGNTSTGAQFICQVPPRDGPNLLVPGFLLTGSACQILAHVNYNATSTAITGLISQSMVSVFGYVNRIVQT